MKNASEMYPLPHEERLLLVKSILLSDALIIVSGLVLADVTASLEHGTWAYAQLGLGWWEGVRPALTLRGWPAMLLAPAALLAVFQGLHGALWSHSRRYRAQVREIRSGVNGELPRLSPALLLVLFAVVGISEEFLFRYAILGFVLFVCSGVLSLPRLLSTLLAVLVSAFVFALAHVQYNNAYANVVVFAIGVFFAFLYLATGSLVVPVVAHWLYDFGDTMAERVRMTREQDYFSGEAPVEAMQRLKAGGGKKSP